MSKTSPTRLMEEVVDIFMANLSAVEEAELLIYIASNTRPAAWEMYMREMGLVPEEVKAR